MRDTGQFLPDTTVLLQVGDRVTRVQDFVDAYFASHAEYRPPSDSLGRVEFLTSILNKEVLALTALAVDRPLSFEDRVVLRGHRERVLSNVTFRRLVADSIRITEDDLRRIYQQYQHQPRLRVIRFGERGTAERVRAGLVAKRLAWTEAVRLHHRPLADEPANGELGWVARETLAPGTAITVYGLAPGEISQVLPESGGFLLYQVVERRKVTPPAFVGVRRLIFMNLRTHLAKQYADRVEAELLEGLDVRHDSTQIAWAASQFSTRPLVESRGPGDLVLNLDREAPHLSGPDADRVLARYRDGEFTLGQFVRAYSEISIAMRPMVGDVHSFREYLNLMILQPYLARLAEERGFDRDPAALAEMARREEQLRVERLYSDSVSSRVWIEPGERRAFYQENLHHLVTFPKVRFAAIARFSQGAAESLLARLRAGEDARDILRADSLLGTVTGSIQERQQNEPGPYHSILFEEMRPGEARAIGPDRAGHWVVIQSLEFDRGRQLSYEEAEHHVDDALRERKSEALLQALIARHKPRYPIVARPEWVMRIRLVDPTLTQMEPESPR